MSEVAENIARYHLPAWSEGYVSANDNGQLEMGVENNHAPLVEIVGALCSKGFNLPVLLRFPQILNHRVDVLVDAFSHSLNQSTSLSYQPIYPVKVNQQNCVVQALSRHPATGLEVGSKPELLLAIAAAKVGGRIVCNGYKDAEYLRLALYARQMGLDVIVVVEKLKDAHLALSAAKEMGVSLRLGVRLRLSTVNSGKWQNTGGEKGKFGLTALQLDELLNLLQTNQMLDSLCLLHCHMGSQIGAIDEVSLGITELAQYWRVLVERGAPIELIDVGGGLAVDYEGTQRNSYFSMSYQLSEYVQAVVQPLAQAQRDYNLPAATILTESGRAMTAHHAVLVAEVSDAEFAFSQVEGESVQSSVEEVVELKSELQQLQKQFAQGKINFESRVKAERAYEKALASAHAHGLSHTLDQRELDKYFCNFSLFQSLPDVWGLEQVFPVVPIHRLNEKPTQQVTLQDLTCDSDGRIDCYACEGEVRQALPLHKYNPEEPYWLGFFLVGAYQEILGDFHNLFGDTHSVNVMLTQEGGFDLMHVEKGDTTAEILDYIHFDATTLWSGYRRHLLASELDASTQLQIERALELGLSGYTYLS